MPKINYILWSVLVVLIFKCSVFAEDREYWNTLVFEKEINKSFNLAFEAEQKFQDDFNRFYSHNYALELYYKMNQLFSYGISYRYEEEESAGNWEKENRITGIAILKWKIRDFSFKNYNKLEYRELETQDKWRYRLKGKVSKKIQIGSYGVNPFISNELFYDFYAEKFNKNRAAVGLAMDIFKNTGLNVYYMKEVCKNSNGDWPGINIFGTELVYSF